MIEVGQRWRHKKRGGVYEIVHLNCSVQVSAMDGTAWGELLESEDWVAYRAIDGWQIYFRMTKEFLDGRFEQVKP